MDQELMFQAQLLQEEAQKVDGQLETVNQQLGELTQFNASLSTFDSSDQKEMLSSLGKGIYAKTNLVSKELYIEVGSGVVVKKTPKQVSEVIEDQLKKLNQMRIQLLGQKEIVQRSMMELIEELQRSQQHEHNHEGHDHSHHDHEHSHQHEEGHDHHNHEEKSSKKSKK